MGTQEKNSAGNRSVPEFLGIDSNESGQIFSTEHITPDELFDMYPVDFIIDFSSSQAIYTYGNDAAERKIKIVSAISHYQKKIFLFERIIKKNYRFLVA